MTIPPSARHKTSPWLSVATVLFAGAIFAIDTFTPLDVAIAVLYVVVVLMAASLFHRRGLLLVSAACLTLTATSFLASHGFKVDAAFLRCLVSLAAIVISTILALANQTTTSILREQAELLDLTHDTVLVRDMEGTITYWNRAAEELYGWPQMLALGRQSHDLLQTVFPMPPSRIDKELLDTGRWEGELIHTTRDGNKVTVSSRWALERDKGGQPQSVLETNTDISVRNKAQGDLLEAQAQLAHVTRVTTLGELAASIAHEVNQPLAAIVTNGEVGLRWLDREKPDIAETRGALTRMIGAARRASEVIARLRALSRRGSSERGPLDVGEVINEVVVLIHRELISRRVVLRLDLDPARPMAIADRVQLQQVIMNLLINGIQAMASVDERSREMVVRLQPHEDNQVLVSIKDSGIGLSPDAEARLFQAFFTTKAEGMGMGLSISRSIVESHGGRIWVTRNDGPGATFQFTLPAEEEQSPAS
jgi:PAS domain S-box-containing protein